MIRDCDKSRDIFDELRETSAKAERLSLRALIIQPGAIGDCLLTIPLARFLKASLGLGGVDLLAHMDYVGFYPNRTCIDAVRSIDTIDLHRLFAASKEYTVVDHDPLVTAFMDYSFIVSFLGEPNSDFESNLVYTVHCSRSADVVVLPLRPPEQYDRHVAEFYCEAVTEQCALLPNWRHQPLSEEVLLRSTLSDEQEGRIILREAGIHDGTPLLLLHPGSGGAFKCWHTDNYIAIAEKMKSRHWAVAFLLGPAEEERMSPSVRSRLAAAGPVLCDLPLDKIVAVMSCSQAFVGNDSGVSHLAALMGIRTLTVFGPTRPSVYGPIGPSVQVFQADAKGFTEHISLDIQQQILAALLC